MTSHDARALAVKRAKAQQLASMAAGFRTFDAAAKGVRLVGNFYELPLAERLDWEERARKAAEALGLISRGEPKP